MFWSEFTLQLYSWFKDKQISQTTHGSWTFFQYFVIVLNWFIPFVKVTELDASWVVNGDYSLFHGVALLIVIS